LSLIVKYANHNGPSILAVANQTLAQNFSRIVIVSQQRLLKSTIDHHHRLRAGDVMFVEKPSLRHPKTEHALHLRADGTNLGTPVPSPQIGRTVPIHREGKLHLERLAESDFRHQRGSLHSGQVLNAL